MKKFLLALAAIQFVSCQYATGKNSDWKVEQLVHNGSAYEGSTALGYHKIIGIPLAEDIRQYELGLHAVAGRRIKLGNVSDLGMQPYQGGLLIELTNGNNSICGCSLLSHTRAVTAAHCWYDGKAQARILTVVLGSTYLYKGGTRITTDNVVMHEQWEPALNVNDIAMIQMKFADFSDIIQPIALPSAEELSLDWSNSTAIISGYGLTEDGQFSTLRYAEVTIIENRNCAKWDHPTNPSPQSIIRPSNICTSSGDVGIHKGDSGGPLAVISRGRPLLVGISGAVEISGGIAFYTYTRISYYIVWINSFM